MLTRPFYENHYIVGKTKLPFKYYGYSIEGTIYSDKGIQFFLLQKLSSTDHPTVVIGAFINKNNYKEYLAKYEMEEFLIENHMLNSIGKDFLNQCFRYYNKIILGKE